MRFVVTAIEGHLAPQTGGGALPGVSFHVVDTCWNHRLVATYRSEDIGGSTMRAERRLRSRGRAEAHARRLNEALDG
jgi:hypothetical protein